MERVATAIAQVSEELGLETLSFDDRLAPEKSVSRRYPMLNRFGTTLRVSRLVRARLRPDDLVISHSMYGAFLAHRRHAYIYHSTFAGQAEAMRELLPSLDYRVCRYGYGWMDGRSGHRSSPVAVSPQVQDEAKRFYSLGAGALRCIPNPVASPPAEMAAARDALRARFGWPPGLFVLLTVGRYEGVKGRHLLDRLATRMPSGTLLTVVAPNISESPWPAEQTSGRVACVPGQSREALWEYVVAADAVLCPSRYESFGLAIAEAWAANRPVISTNVGIARALRTEEESLDRLIIEQPGDVDALLERIELLRSTPELGARQAAWGQQIVHDRFTPERFNKAYRALLQELQDQ